MEKVYSGNSRKSGVYRIRYKKTGKPYIGSASEFKRRSTEHERSLRNNKHQNKPLQNAWNKYGEDNFIFEILEVIEGKSIRKRRTIEQKYIDEVWPNCFNIQRKTVKTKGPWASTPEETKRKMKGRIPWNKGIKQGPLSEETKQKMSEAHKGQSSWNKGKFGYKTKPRSEEAKKKMSKSHKGQIPWNKGKQHSKETLKKISKALKGIAPWNKGKKASNETKKKLRKAWKHRKLRNERNRVKN